MSMYRCADESRIITMLRVGSYGLDGGVVFVVSSSYCI